MGGSIFYRWQGADDALIVGDFLVGIEGDVEVNLYEFTSCQLSVFEEVRVRREGLRWKAGCQARAENYLLE